MSLVLHARRALVDGRALLDVEVEVGEDGDVIGVRDGTRPRPGTLDLGDADLLPGLVDLHSDCLEMRARPRPTSDLGLESALLDLDAEVVVHGITTHFACASLHTDYAKLRSPERARETVDVIESLRPHLRADHRVHLRVELLDDGVEHVLDLAKREVVGIVSYMDHTPGQGQYRDPDNLRRQLADKTDDEATAIIERRIAKSADEGRREHDRERVAEAARDGGAVLASHDDDRRAYVERARELDAGISEFPVTMEAAEAANDLGLGTVMGAPNARRGRSHVDNLGAPEVIAAGLLDALSSDYHPASLLAAVYELSDRGTCDWATAASLATEGPARIAGLHDRGALLPGRQADLVAVVRRGGRPSVRQVWRAGTPVFA